jgi:DNA helicase-2/ATP-dependent DNA helicase PcrA
MQVPNNAQRAIIEEPDNCVVIAAPGSGKTFVLSEKIKLLLKELPNYQGVIAISFTNKASQELKNRALSNGTEPKNSFFGTIDKFCVTEIILSFGKQIFGFPQKEFKVIDKKNFKSNITDDETIRILNSISHVNSDSLTDEQIQCLQHLFVNEGIVVLNFLGITANYIIENSISCRNYIKAKYSHIIIDEYQDSDFEQNKLFLKLTELELTGIAVGDIRQAIFGFAGKKSSFLSELTKRDGFKSLSLTRNFRCHISISNYSQLFLKTGIETLNPVLGETDEIRVYEKQVTGSEIDIAKWIEKVIPIIKNKYSIENKNEIGILVKNKRSGKIIDTNLALPHRFVSETPLDWDVSYSSNLFSSLLYFGYDENKTAFELLRSFFDIYNNKQLVKKLLPILQTFRQYLNGYDCQDGEEKKSVLSSFFLEIANIIYPNKTDNNSIQLLNKVLSSNEFLMSYFPPKDNEIQILTLFKAKGLEFDLVFHLDLYSYILPQEYGGKFKDINQDANLHYVGITRAKKCCILLHSTERHKSSGGISNANPSLFLSDKLKEYRIKLKN